MSNVMVPLKKKFTMLICKVELTEKEWEEQVELMNVKSRELEEIELQKKSAQTSFKERAERTSGEFREARRLVEDKFDMVDVECEVIKDYDKGIVSYIRQDTYSVEKTTAMTQLERQMHLDEILKKEQEEEEKAKGAAGDASEFAGDIDKNTELAPWEERGPGKQSGSLGGLEKSDEELRQEKEARLLIAGEKTVKH